ncbi:MAG: hypothetical protein HQL82_07520 [Magnetococcales bacterium]|nr:hypothetical protein [Magnetococcales bacterium]
MTISNTILEYLRAGLAMVASPVGLGCILKGRLVHSERRTTVRAASQKAVPTTCCWERVAPDLVELVTDNTLNGTWRSNG